MELLLYNFSKRKNSTKQPTNDNLLATKNVLMKRETSVINPTFLISNVNLSINYCKWNSSYYFVDDIVLNDGDMYEIRCTIDPLATLKSTILSTSANIMYASGSTKNIIDTRIPLTANVEIQENVHALSNVTIVDETMGAVVLGLTGKGSFGAYLMQNSTKISQLLDGVDSWWDIVIGESTSSITAIKQLMYGGSAGECLKSAIALPLLFSPADVSAGGDGVDIVLGNYPCKDTNGNNIKGYKITKPLLFDVTNIDIPWKYSDWRRNPPYCQIILYLPFVGLISLPTADLINDTSLNIKYAFNVTSGDFSVQIMGNQSQRIFSTSSGNIAMNTAYGSTGIDTNKLTTSVVAGATAVVGGVASMIMSGGLSTPAVLGIAGGMATAAGGTLSALGGTGQGNGGLGGGATHGLDKVIHCICVSRTLTDTQADLNPIMGKPYMGKATVGSFSGYVQTEGFSISSSMLSQINEMVNKLMDSGVYIE